MCLTSGQGHVHNVIFELTLLPANSLGQPGTELLIKLTPKGVVVSFLFCLLSSPIVSQSPPWWHGSPQITDFVLQASCVVDVQDIRCLDTT